MSLLEGRSEHLDPTPEHDDSSPESVLNMSAEEYSEALREARLRNLGIIEKNLATLKGLSKKSKILTVNPLPDDHPYFRDGQAFISPTYSGVGNLIGVWAVDVVSDGEVAFRGSIDLYRETNEEGIGYTLLVADEMTGHYLPASLREEERLTSVLEFLPPVVS